MTRTAIVVTGLPASGKSTLARAIAVELRLSFLDKDDFLERLYEMEVVSDQATRQQLSRRSDRDFIAAARGLESAVLVSHWRNAACGPGSGTPIEWLTETFEQVIEVYCACPVDLAVERFMARKRHSGHQDNARTGSELRNTFAAYATDLPIGLGTLLSINGEVSVSPHDAADLIRRHIL